MNTAESILQQFQSKKRIQLIGVVVRSLGSELLEDGKSYWQSNGRVTYALLEWLPQVGNGAYIVENSRSYELITKIMQEHAVETGSVAA
jgi:hypothetical protein